ncbi:hypothetical protein KAJ02_13160, partial [Candidatus Bipolaricaulota bacterium]|nr:hypothetical protein [Candidatus Bipolaricaulota bacterium]
MQRIIDPDSRKVAVVRVALAQLNSTVGDLDGNTARIIACIHQASHDGADVIVFPELAICGYPPEDLLLRPRFISQNLSCLRTIAESTHGPVVAVGFVDSDSDVFNAAAIVHDGHIACVYHKVFLP